MAMPDLIARVERASAELETMAGAARTLRTPCGAGTMVWRVWGQGPPLLLVHGGAGAWSHWIRNLPVLMQHHTVIAPDTPGLGDSARPPGSNDPERIADIMAEGLTAILPEVHTRRSGVDIVGFSFGGLLAGLVAERLASLAGRLVLIGASGLGGHFDALQAVQALPAKADPATLLAVHRHNLSVMMLHDPAAIDAVALAVQSVNAPKTRVRSPRYALGTQLADSLRRSGVRFHSLWGEHCIFSNDLERRRRLLQSIDMQSRFVVVAGAGHWAQYEAAQTVNRQLLEWIGN
ncbi:MAG: alpha/beta fold hydrolase [Gammaproteobacteria bacterium]|nr:alpha/beta fold hydrolase [Gammaproteobacteria bacterium]